MQSKRCKRILPFLFMLVVLAALAILAPAKASAAGWLELKATKLFWEPAKCDVPYALKIKVYNGTDRPADIGGAVIGMQSYYVEVNDKPITVPDGVVLAPGESYTVPKNLVFVQPSHPYISGSKEGYDLTLNGAYSGSVSIEFVPPEYTYMTAKVLKEDGSPAGDALYAGHRYLAEISFANTYQTGLRWYNMRGSLGDTAPIHWYPDTRLAFSQNNDTDAYLVQDVMPGETAAFRGYFDVPESMPEGRKTLRFNAEILGSDYSLPIAPPDQTFYIHSSDPVIRKVSLSSEQLKVPAPGEMFLYPADLHEPEGAYYYAEDKGSVRYGTRWVENGSYQNTPMEPGTEYVYSVTVRARDSFKFAPDAQLSINGTAPDYAEIEDDRVTMHFECTVSDSRQIQTPYKDGTIEKQMNFSWDKWKELAQPENNYLDTSMAALIMSAQIENGLDDLKTSFLDLGLIAYDKFDPAYQTAYYDNGGKDDNGDKDDNSSNPTLVSHAFAIREINLYGVGKRNLVTIVAKGTTSGKDGVTDVLPTGFQRGADEIVENLGRFLAKNGSFIGDSSNVYFLTGHSLGAAVTNLTAGMLQKDHGCQNVVAYEFATPYVIEEKNKNYGVSNSVIHNWINMNDAVPFLRNPTTANNSRYGRDYAFVSTADKNLYNHAFRELTGENWAPQLPLVGHLTRNYMAQLMTYATNYQTTYQDGKWVLSIRCPVDVEVLNAEGQVVAEIRNNEVIQNSAPENMCLLVVNGDEKQIYLDQDAEYTIRLTGTDTGTMSYDVAMVKYTEESAEILSQKTFKEVALTAGKKMISPIKKGVTAKEVPLFVLDDKGAADKDVQPDGTEVKHKHAYGEWQVVTASTCTQPGQERRVCGLCGTEETRPLPLAEHEYEYGICKNCGAKDPNYVAIPHKIVVENGRAFADGKEVSDAVPGTEITVVADAAQDDLLFDFWEVVTGDLKLETPDQQETSFVMPESDVTLRAKYKLDPEHQDEHVHELDDVWHSDGNGHWHECPCGAKGGISLHEFGEWQELAAATATEPGKAVRTCRVCGYQMTSLTPALGEAAAPATGDPGNAVWWTLLALSLAGIGTAAVKRRRDHSVK